jgi:hypothetical protein
MIRLTEQLSLLGRQIQLYKKAIAISPK